MRVIKRVIGTQIKRAFYTTRLHALLKRMHPSPYPLILRYHSIGSEHPLICESITVSLHEFEEQVRYFSKNFLTVSLTTLVDCLRHKRAFPPNALVLTFDDGYADNYGAARVLQQYGMTGLFYITAGCIESEEKFWIAEIRHLLRYTQQLQVCVPFPQEPYTASLQTPADRVAAMDRLTYLLKTVDVSRREEIRAMLRTQLGKVPPFPDDLMLTWGHLKDMAAMGMEIGAHTMTHANLPSASSDEAWFEIAESKSTLEKRLGIKVSHLAYPNGGSVQHYNDRIKQQVQQAGFLSATTSQSGILRHSSDVFAIRRVRATNRIFEMLWEMEEEQRNAVMP